MCINSKQKEKYSLPFVGGDIRTFTSNQHRINSPLYSEMDKIDEDAGWESSDYPR